MPSLSYTISPILRDHLLEIESLKRKILLPPLSFSSETTLRFDTFVERVYLLVKPEGFTRKQLRDYLLLHQAAKQTIRRLHHSEERIDAFKQAFDYVLINWRVTPKPLTASEVIKMNQKFYGGKLRIDKAVFVELFEYLETQKDSPVIQSTLAMSQMQRLSPFTKENTLMAHLVSLIYLEKGGYNFRELVFWESEAFKELGTYQAKLSQAADHENQTLWLEYVSSMLCQNLQTIITTVSKERKREGWESEGFQDDVNMNTSTSNTIPSIAVTERQRAILQYLETPAARITNKTVQGLFTISQITASRELSQLTRLGLIMQHGHGRSIYYTRFI